MNDPPSQRIVETYKRLTEQYDEVVAGQPFFINCYALYDKLMDLLLTGRTYQRILDVGCGNGLQTVRLARHGKEVIGVDISEELLEVARQRCRGLSNVTLMKEDARKLPFQDDSFDCIFSYGDVLSHIVDGYEQALSEMSRVAKRGAVVTFEVDNKWHLGIPYHPRELWHNLRHRGRGHTERRWEGMQFKTFTHPELVGLLKKHRLELVEYHGHNILSSIIPDRYMLDRWDKSLLGRAGIALGRLDLILSGTFPFHRLGFNNMVIMKKI
jgi:ubiquinone/menaquinone biosynthesis C-methylase UbiE